MSIKMIDRAVGILGGLGPLATVYFMEMLIRMTEADTDQQHIDMVVLNHSSIPDRTDYILGRSGENPLEIMREDARKLEAAGASFIVMPCNTAHYFYDGIRDGLGIEMLSIVEETAAYTLRVMPGVKRVGILATSGTVESGTYPLEFGRLGVECLTPGRGFQDRLTDIIYNQIKAGKPPDMGAFEEIADELRGSGCEALVLGCTELSVISRARGWNTGIIDSLEALAVKTIEKCGKKVRPEYRRDAKEGRI